MIDFVKEEKNINEAIGHFEGDLKDLRTGRAHASMVEHIEIEAYGAKTPLMHVAAISTPDARSLVIKPWDKTMMPLIEQALAKSNLGAQPIADKDQIRLSMPAPTEERRRELVKLLGKKAEESRIGIRRIRDDIWKTIQEEEKGGKISEDQKFSQKDKMEKLIEDANKKIADITAKKEKEIMEV